MGIELQKTEWREDFVEDTGRRKAENWVKSLVKSLRSNQHNEARKPMTETLWGVHCPKLDLPHSSLLHLGKHFQKTLLVVGTVKGSAPRKCHSAITMLKSALCTEEMHADFPQAQAWLDILNISSIIRSTQSTVIWRSFCYILDLENESLSKSMQLRILISIWHYCHWCKSVVIF